MLQGMYYNNNTNTTTNNNNMQNIIVIVIDIVIDIAIRRKWGDKEVLFLSAISYYHPMFKNGFKDLTLNDKDLTLFYNELQTDQQKNATQVC